MVALIIQSDFVYPLIILRNFVSDVRYTCKCLCFAPTMERGTCASNVVYFWRHHTYGLILINFVDAISIVFICDNTAKILNGQTCPSSLFRENIFALITAPFPPGCYRLCFLCLCILSPHSATIFSK